MPGTELDHLQTLRIALNTTPGVSRPALCVLASDAGWLARRGRGSPKRAPGLDASSLSSIRRVLADAERVAGRERLGADRAGAVIVPLGHRDYPEVLAVTSEPPPALYIRGELPDDPGLAIVGSRRSDRYGLDVSELFARALAAAGLTIVSGLARGVDTAAHRGALSAPGGRTVAVLGCGIDVEYPTASAGLATAIARDGAVVSELPMGTPPLPFHFPLRNRILAALGVGTLVVRATARSGSLITARLALELGREIFAVPGEVFSPGSVGPNCLIRDGAVPVQHPREVIESLKLEVREKLTPPAPAGSTSAAPDAHLASLLDALERLEPATAEELAEALGTDVGETLARLTELELGGWSERLPGSRYATRH